MVRAKAESLTLISLILLISMVGMAHSSSSTDAPEQTVNMVEVTIEETSIPIDISFNGSFEGKLHCSARLLLNLGLFAESVDVFLDPTFPDEISVSLDDYDFTLTQEDPVFEFTANVTVHPGTSSTQVPTIVIDGTTTAQPTGTKGGIVEDSATVNILPFYTAEISFSSSSGEIHKGDSKEFTLIVENRGNAGETYILNWANEDELRNKDIKVEFDEANVQIPEGSRKEVKVKIWTGDRTTRGSYLIRIEVWSERNGRGNIEESNAVITIDVSDLYLDGIQKFFGASPYVIYVTGAVILIGIAFVVYFSLRVRANRAWKKRLTEYQEYEDETDGPVKFEAVTDDGTHI